MKTHTTLKALLLLPLAAGVMATSACTLALLDTAASGIFPNEDINFTSQNYSAADYLIQQAKPFVDRYSVIQAQPLSDTDQPNMESTYGKMVPEQIGIRLSQLGYRMDLSTVATAADTNYLKPAASSLKKDPDFILSGTFTRRRVEVDVSTRIIDTRNGRVIAVFDYTLPRSREVDDLAKPIPKITRVE